MNLFLLLLALLLLILPVLGGAFFLFFRSVRRALALAFPAGRRLCIWLAAAATALAAGAFVLFWRVFPV
ncbi:MAG: hypothetical protein IJL69_06980, partial [Oscillospiraceae bacterium]|nr:hypothetical protein [Oscillospiraceae bacterium]